MASGNPCPSSNCRNRFANVYFRYRDLRRGCSTSVQHFSPFVIGIGKGYEHFAANIVFHFIGQTAVVVVVVVRWVGTYVGV